MRMISLWFDDKHLGELKRLAKKKGLKFSQLIRLAVSEYIDRERKKEENDKRKTK